LDDSFCEWIQSGKVKHNEYWENWQKVNKDQIILLEEASQLVLQLQFRHKEFTEAEVDKELGILLQKLPSTTILTQPKTTIYKWVVAASLAILLTAGWILFNFLGVGLVTYQTAYGEIKEFHLSDDTKVVLQANSTLSAPKKWDISEHRTVQLKGEAFFEVTSSPSRTKFTVQGDGFQVQVLGTMFNVLSREATKRVALQEGKIRFTSADQSLELAPDELLTYRASSKKFIKSNVKATTHTMWTKKVLQLDRMNLQELIRIIQDNYGYTVQTNLADTNITKSIIGKISINELDDLLTIIEGAYGLEVKQENQQVLLFSK